MVETSLTLLSRLQQESDPEAWQRLVDIYAPLIGRWLARSKMQMADHEDLVQEVLKIVVQKLPNFERRREGSFRTWLRVITVNCLRAHWRSEKHRAFATGDSEFLQQLQQLEDPCSELSQAWEAEHDRHVVRRLLKLIEPQFQPTTLRAFRRVVMDGQKPVPREQPYRACSWAVRITWRRNRSAMRIPRTRGPISTAWDARSIIS